MHERLGTVKCLDRGVLFGKVVDNLRMKLSTPQTAREALKPLNGNELDAQRDAMFDGLPELFTQTEAFLKAMPERARATTVTVVRTFGTYSAYEDPISD